jgi:hypothetical protein
VFGRMGSVDDQEGPTGLFVDWDGMGWDGMGWDGMGCCSFLYLQII